MALVLLDDLQDGEVKGQGIEDRAAWVVVVGRAHLGVFARDSNIKRMAGGQLCMSRRDCEMWIVGEWRR